jgi:signal transduction histidine kinase
VTLTLRQLGLEANMRTAEIGVADTGDGISLEDQKKIFERFYRAARPLRGESPNTGIGLALGQWIAEQHESSTNVQSAPGVGSRFSMLLPVTSNRQESERLQPLVSDSHLASGRLSS